MFLPFSIAPALFWVGTAGYVGSAILSWQIYEAHFPSVDRQMKAMNYKFNPIKPPNDPRTKETEDNFDWKSWDCVKRLFPGVKFAHNIPSKYINTSGPSRYTKVKPVGYANKTYIGCAQMEMNSWGNRSDQLYFKAEVVFKNDEVAWIVWVGIDSTYKEGEEVYRPTFKYRTVLMKKKNNKWEASGGYEWNNFIDFRVIKEQKLYIKTPLTTWLNGRTFVDTTPIPHRKWVGVWELSGDGSNGTHPLDGVSVYFEKPERAEMLGRIKDLEFQDSCGAHCGYDWVYLFYQNVPEPLWKRFYLGAYYRNMPKFRIWYKPFSKKKGTWYDLYSRCDSLSRRKGVRVSDLSDITKLCYSK